MFGRNRALEAREREFARERNQWMQLVRELNDRLMYLSGSPWTPPPLPTSEPVEEREELLYDVGPENFVETV